MNRATVKLIETLCGKTEKLQNRVREDPVHDLLSEAKDILMRALREAEEIQRQRLTIPK